MAKKLGKMNFKKVLTNSAVVAGTGALSQVVATLVEGELDATTGRNKNAEMVDYAMIAAGIILPEVIKNDMVNTASGALLAVGAYRMATAHNLAGVIGVNGIGTTAAFHAVNGGNWNPRNTTKATKATVTGEAKGSKTVY